ncbi:MAG: hypothetical protein KF890_15220 [Nitrospira sp.]|nr:hypothetical protein [Nitrospira sp.]
MKKIRYMLPMCVSLPIWFYLTYQVLDRVEATELMWFLFWVYVPVTIFTAILAVITDEATKK